MCVYKIYSCWRAPGARGDRKRCVLHMTSELRKIEYLRHGSFLRKMYHVPTHFTYLYCRFGARYNNLVKFSTH